MWIPVALAATLVVVDRGRRSCGRAGSCATTSRPRPRPSPRPRPRTTGSPAALDHDRAADGERIRRDRRIGAATGGSGSTTAHRRIGLDDREPVTDNERLRARFIAEHAVPARRLPAPGARRARRRPVGARRRADRCGQDARRRVRDRRRARVGRQDLLHDPAQGAVESEVRRLRPPLRRRERRPAHRRQRRQRRGADRGDDDRGAAQHDLRAAHRRSTACATPCSTRSTTCRIPPGARCGRR